MKTRALEGLQVLELGTLIAGPFAARLLGDFGAEVIKVEPPGSGDPLRQVRERWAGHPLWWLIQSRNKKSVTINLRRPEGQEIARRLIAGVDVLIENFKPGALERWGLGWEQLHGVNPRLIMVRISGFGQTGPYREKPGFGSVAEAIGGLRYITGYPDLPPVRVGISLGDSIAAFHAVLGTLVALYRRDVIGTGEGQLVDVALYESVFNLMEGMLPEYDALGKVRERTGAALPGFVPSNTYRCKDDRYIVIGGNADSVYRRLMNAIGREDLADDPRFQTGPHRAKAAELLDGAIEEWTQQRTLQEVAETLDSAEVPCGPIYSIADIANDHHYQARGMFEEWELPGAGWIKLPTIVPKLSETPGLVEWVGPRLGAHTEEILKARLGLTNEEFASLLEAGVI
jgi:crotonobetainyl-CoA:carnitine CoA-transferase CaiB-like acyl-CoA transferase